MIEIKDLSINLEEFQLKDINLTVSDREYFVILGPTGAGKTVLIECIAGLHRIKQGEIWVDGKNVTRMTPEERNVGYVPQEYVLFPFLNVAGNIAFGLRQTSLDKSAIKERVKTLANLLGVSHILNRDTRTLSGGEKQRVALARALAPYPKILLLDEPLSALDLQTAKYLRSELQRIHQELGVTTLHITHDQIEAEEISDRIAILNAGRIEQVGEAEEVFFYPESDAVSNFIGTPNILDCDECRAVGQGMMEVDCRGLKIILPHDGNTIQRIALFPRDIYISDTQTPGLQINRFKGAITNIKSLGATVKIQVKSGENTLRAEMPHHVFEEMNLEMGREVFVTLRLRRIRVFEGKKTLHKKVAGK
jgi:molybdate/tungstate transport system ATP-binding protein